ncbi:MAG: DUF2007 domain-containing protein [Spirochaetales bacterium]|nr:DUF2007 domain-containing protein [Spirochaetales bacterium]MCF7937346.1 DUF2007 domain-containing protein [Spirochaetales bacterium]
MEKVLTLNNEIEAQLLSSLLKEAGVPHYMHSYHDSAYDGIFQVQFGWGHVESEPEYAEEIKDIYNSMKNTGSAEEGPEPE